MNSTILITTIVVLLCWPFGSSAQGAWLLWEHWRGSVANQKDIEEKEKSGAGDSPYYPNIWKTSINTWSVENAFETRTECLKALPTRIDEHIRITRWAEEDTKEKTRFNKRPPNKDSIRAELVKVRTFTDNVGVSKREVVTIYLWCLPAGVDPHAIGND